MKFLVPFAIAGLGSIPMLPTEWLQLGVAGISLTILFWFITRTHPQALQEERQHNSENMASLFSAHNKSTEKICDRFDTIAERQMRLMEKALDTRESGEWPQDGKEGD